MSPLQEFISLLVEDKGPIKGVDLAVEIATHQHGSRPEDIIEAIADLVECGEIVEVEYILELPGQIRLLSQRDQTEGSRRNMIVKVQKPLYSPAMARRWRWSTTSLAGHG